MNNSQNNITEGALLADDQFLRRIAHLYFEAGETQEAIAAKENYSRQTISKALQKAKERGIVRTSIVPEERTGYLRNLERDLRLSLKLEDLIIVPGRNLEELTFSSIADGVLADISTAAADYLDQLLKDDDIIAVSGGKNIMRHVVRYLKPSKRLPNLQVVSTMGFVRSFTNFGDPNLIAHDIATAYGAKHAWLPIPAIVETQEQCELARSLPLVRDVLEMVEHANLTIMGLWPYNIGEDYLVKRNIVSEEKMKVFQFHKPVVDINHWLFDKSGKCINQLVSQPPYYLTGLEIPQLKDKIINLGAKVILVAGASQSYVAGLLAILRAGIANILITDHITAELLNERLQTERR